MRTAAKPVARRRDLFRLAIFASGDFAFNLYWQSVMLYLLFYYTDALSIGIATAAATYVAASIWDGVASFVVGAVADRRGSARHYRLALAVGAVPLGLAFALAYLPPPAAGGAGVAFILVGHLLFRTAYALVNIPYLAMSARISADSRDRTLVAGLRMLAGTAAAVTVALGTVPLGGWLGAGPRAYLGAALLFAGVATAILMFVGLTYRDGDVPESGPPPTIRAALASLAANRAFVTLAAAMMAMIVAVTMLNKSVLYYFKYSLGDERGGQVALAWMMAVSALAVPVWLALSRAIGVRALWFVAAGLCVAMLAMFAAVDTANERVAQVLFVALQGAIVGLNFAFWAMLPDTIEYGQRATGVRVEGAVYGLATLLQRVAIGAATAILGWRYGSAGYVANVAQSEGTLASMRVTITLAPMAFFALSALVMLANPLRKGTHERVLRELAGR